MLKRLFWSEVIGSALLVLGGLSLVIFMFGIGTPMARILPSEGWRRLITGFFFGSTGALIAISPVGKASGAHINPAVRLAFRWMGKLDTRTSLVYIGGQCLGGILGCVPLLAWGNMGKSVAYGATTPGAGYSVLAALTGEFLTTFLMVALRLAVALRHRAGHGSAAAIRPGRFNVAEPNYWQEGPFEKPRHGQDQR